MTLIRWPHDVHVLVSPDASKRLGVQAGALIHVQAGDPFDMPDEEAAARIEAGDVITLVEPPRVDPPKPVKPDKAVTE